MIFREAGDGDSVVGGCRSFDSGEGGWLTRFHTLDDVLSGTTELVVDSPSCRINAVCTPALFSLFFLIKK